jgi:ubiquinone/menaquinone biosynthesis C-methylase UbiE
VHTVDESPDMLEVARTKVPDVQFTRGDLRTLPLPSQSVDLVANSLGQGSVRGGVERGMRMADRPA